jgi:hypothetical protein
LTVFFEGFKKRCNQAVLCLPLDQRSQIVI